MMMIMNNYEAFLAYTTRQVADLFQIVSCRKIVLVTLIPVRILLCYYGMFLPGRHLPGKRKLGHNSKAHRLSQRYGERVSSVR